MAYRLLTLAFMMCLAGDACAQDRATKVRNDREQLKDSQVWIYNDLAEGFKEAKRSGKPLFVTIRCIPCEACSRFDKKLLDRQNEVQDLLDQFVCVRVVQGNHLDLRLFQFDYDQSFHAFFLNADKTIYGRFGTRSAREEEADMTMPGLRQAMLAALDLHGQYPANKERLQGKQSHPVEFAVPEEYPNLKGKYTEKLNYEGNVVASCIHCHQIRDSERQLYRSRNEPLPEQVLFPYPLPDVLGLAMNPNQCATVADVKTNSVAARAGLQPGDRIQSLDGQPLLSTADLQWVLQHAEASEQLHADVLRGNERRQITIDLPAGWRRESDISFRVSTWELRRMGTGGMRLAELAPSDRQSRQLEAGQMALLVQHVGEYGAHATAKRAGFQKGDVLIAIDGKRDLLSEGKFLAYTLGLPSGGKAIITVLRGEKELELELPMQQ
jgi:hypothetical protein